MFTQSQPENLFMNSASQQGPDTKESQSLSSKREQFNVEIRNRDRLNYFKARQEQNRQIFTQNKTQKLYTPELLHKVKSSLDQNTNSVVQMILQHFTVQQDVLQLAELKAFYQFDVPVYDILFGQTEQGSLFLGKCFECLILSIEPEHRELAAYHLNNLIYFGGRYSQKGQQLDLQTIMENLCRKLRETCENELATAANILYCLANLYGDEETYQGKLLMTQAVPLVEILTEVTNRANVTSEEHINFTNGMLWVLRNLIYQESKYSILGKQSLKILETLWPDVQRYLKNGTTGFQIGEDFLFILMYVVKKAQDEELSEFFDQHITLMIGVVTQDWPEEQYLNVAQVLTNITYGQDDVLEQLLELGVIELIQKILDFSFGEGKKQIAVQQKIIQDCQVEILQTIGYFFCADDCQISERVLEGLGGIKLLKKLVDLTLPNHESNIIEESLHTITTLVKNNSEVYQDLIELLLIEHVLECLQTQISNEVELEILELLLQFLKLDEQEGQEQVRLIIQNHNGIVLVSKSLDSQNVMAYELALQILQYFKEL